MAYSRDDTTWIYEYYSGVDRKAIANRLCRGEDAVKSRLYWMGLPVRPRGRFSGRSKQRWLQRPDVLALRLQYQPQPQPRTNHNE